MSELLKILLVGQELLGVDRSLAYLVHRSGVSPATLKRYLGELRHQAGVDREATAKQQDGKLHLPAQSSPP
jgi:hypothetical protein